MTMPSPKPAAAPWGDRIDLLPKKMLYAVSLQLTVVARGTTLTLQNDQGTIGHILGDTIVTTPEGLRCDVPRGRIASVEGDLGSRDDASSSSFRMRIRAQLEGAGPLLMNCIGVVNFNGGAGAFRAGAALAGKVFLASKHETASPSYRWLNRRQLFGVGRLQGHGRSSQEPAFALSFDLYAAA